MEDNLMGYQESMLVCNTKENFEKLCKKLNASKAELSDFVSVYAIGKTKATLMLSDPWDEHSNMGFIPAGSYFVWWGGERHPFQSGRSLTKEEKRMFNPDSPYWRCVFCEYIKEMHEVVCDMDLDNSDGIVQENKMIRLCEIPSDDLIKDEYIQLLE